GAPGNCTGCSLDRGGHVETRRTCRSRLKRIRRRRGRSRSKNAEQAYPGGIGLELGGYVYRASLNFRSMYRLVAVIRHHGTWTQFMKFCYHKDGYFQISQCTEVRKDALLEG